MPVLTAISICRLLRGVLQGIFLGGHYSVTPKAVLHGGGKGIVKRCEYFIKCCNCSQLLAARDFPEHTGELDLHQSSNQWI